MYTPKKADKTSLKVNKSYEGESLEKKINRIVNNKEPIKDNAPLIYTDRKDGVRPEMNVRTDRWEMAIDEIDAKVRNHVAKREARIVEMNKPNSDGEPGGESGKPASTDGTK